MASDPEAAAIAARPPMPDAPKRIQRKRTKGWRMPEGAVYVGRGSAWANPWRVVKSGRSLDDGAQMWSGRHDWEINYPMVPDRREAAQRACDCYRQWIQANVVPDLIRLRGKTLACFCPLDQPCHADILLELANAPLRCEAAAP